MDNLDYNGSLTEDIKTIKRVNKRDIKLWNKLDIVYILTLIILCIIMITRLINGEPYLPLVNYTSSILIIVRNVLHMKFNRDRVKSYNAKIKIHLLINDICNNKEKKTNNQAARIDVDDIVDSLVIKTSSETKKYDDYNHLYKDIEKLYNYIYFLDEHEQINLLKEIKTKIKKPNTQKMEKIELELVDIDDPNELSVKQVLKLKK